MRPFGGSERDLKLADVRRLLFHGGVNFQPGLQRRGRKLPLRITHDEIRHLHRGFDGGTALRIILHGGVAVDGDGDEFLVRQQRFKEWAQAVLVETRQASGQLRRFMRGVVFAGNLKSAAGIPALGQFARDFVDLDLLRCFAHVEVHRAPEIAELVLAGLSREIGEHQFAGDGLRVLFLGDASLQFNGAA